VENVKADEDFSYQEISKSKVAGHLKDLLNDTSVNYLKIHSEPERGDLESVDAGTFNNLVELFELEVNHHKVKNIDKKAFEQNVNLMKINFSDNEITDLDPELFKNLLQLREVFFQKNRLRSLPENLFEKNVDLETINFAQNAIQEVPFNLFDKLDNLEEIYLNDNRIKTISDQFYKKNNLWNFQLNNNEIEKIEVSGVVKKIDFQNLLEINLSNNKLTALPGNIFNSLEAIDRIDLSNNAIQSLNFDTFLDTSIDTLDFSNNEIVEISRDFPDNFREIILTDNIIRKIYDSLYKNKKKLENLDLRGNQIEEIFVAERNPRSVDEDDGEGEFEDNFITIDLSANNLKELKLFTFASIKSISYLDLSKNNLKFLPENLFDGSNVHVLNFANNLIEELDPNSFENAQLDVSRADFSNNKIELLDENFFEKWISLNELNFGHNQIKILPEKLFDRVKYNLEKISFADNQISKIGSNIFVNCKKLAHIDLRNNTCFDAIFDDDRKQHEVCSNNCEDSCFIVNQIAVGTTQRPEHPQYAPPGILYGEIKCKKGRKFITGMCRNFRMLKKAKPTS
jgi:Leucine-rich repeat (LRR) protein